jgi:hypothetical protein
MFTAEPLRSQREFSSSDPIGPSPRRPAAPAHNAARVAPATQAGDGDWVKNTPRVYPHRRASARKRDQKQLALKGLIALDLAVSPAKSEIPCLRVLCDSAVRSSFLN